MESFYGGRQGVSFVIVKKYKSVTEMINDYANIIIGQYVAVFPDNVNDRDNGKLYMRSAAGDVGTEAYKPYQYIGQICGPQGDAIAPSLISSYEDNAINAAIASAIADLKKDYGDRGFAQDTDRTKTGEYTISNGSLVSGYKDGAYVDDIKFKQVYIKDNTGHLYDCIVGFQIPYMFFETASKRVVPYNSDGNKADMSKAIISHEGSDGENHPFYSKITFDIPQGVKGDSVKAIDVIYKQVQAGAPIYNSSFVKQEGKTVDITSDLVWNEASYNGQGYARLSGADNYIKLDDVNDDGRYYCITPALRLTLVNYDNKQDGEISYKLAEYTNLDVLKDGNFQNVNTVTDEHDGIIYIKALEFRDFKNRLLKTIQLDYVKEAVHAKKAGDNTYVTNFEQVDINTENDTKIYLTVKSTKADGSEITRDNKVSLEIKELTNEQITNIFTAAKNKIYNAGDGSAETPTE